MALGLLAFLPATLNLSFLYEITRRNVRYSYIYLIERCAYVAITSFLLLKYGAGLATVFIILLIVTLLSLLFQIYDNRFYLKNFIHGNTVTIKKIFLDNFPLLLISLALYSYSGFSRLILENKLGLAMLGIYSLGWQLTKLAVIFQSQVTRVWRLDLLKILADRNSKELRHVIKCYFLFSTLPIIIGGTIMSLFANELVKLLFSPEYRPVVELVPVIAVYFFIINLASLAKIFWISMERNTLYMIINVFFAMALVFILRLLPMSMGMYGFAVVTVLVHGMATLVLFYIWWLVIRSDFKS